MANTTMTVDHVFMNMSILGCVVGSLVCLAGGMAIGFSGMVLPELAKDDTIVYDKSYDSWVASIVGLSAIFGGLFIGPILDCFGRKTSLLLTIFPFILGWLLMALAKTVLAILIGRFLLGLCYGSTKIISVVYAGEIFDPKYRATALLLPSLSANFGLLMYHLMAYYVYWRTCCLLSIAPILIAFIILLFLKESPLWFIMKGRVEEGIETFIWFRGSDNVSRQELEQVIQEQTCKTTIKDIVALMKTKSFIKCIVTVLFLISCVQFSGVHTITFYVADIVHETFSDTIDTFSVIMAIDVSIFISSMLMCYWANAFPRKINFLCASFSTSVLLLYLTIVTYMKSPWAWAVAVGMVLYVCTSSYILSLSWSFLPEMFPGKIRGFASGLSTAVSYTFLFICVKFSPVISLAMGKEVTFCIFFGITLFCTIFLCFLLPETNGKTLQEIEDSCCKEKKIVYISKL